MKVFGIFEGGGAKGLAHVGAFRACEDKEISFCGVAGASAGAIVASLIAVGYRSSELFDHANPGDDGAVYKVDLREILGSELPWSELERALEDAKALPKLDGYELGWKCWRFTRNHKRIVELLKNELGIFSTTKFIEYLDSKLEKKLLENDPGLIVSRGFGRERGDGLPRVVFKDVRMPLKIVATDVDTRKLVVFSAAETPNFSVARAVAASIALPIVFRPQEVLVPSHDGTERLIRGIDGGLLSNFPAWLFDQERVVAGPNVPTLGFQLIATKPDDMTVAWSRLARHISGVVGTVLSGDPLLETREIDNLHEIPLRVSFGTLDFELTESEKVQLFGEGYQGAMQGFNRPGFPVDVALAQKYLESLISTFKQKFQVDLSVLVRANIVMLTRRKTLRVTYSCYMDSDQDTDDRLEFAFGSGACGHCWTSKEPVICDLEEAKLNFHKMWKMNKYQQATVRRDLKSLICYPILDSTGEEMLGVLNLDSPDPGMLELFFDERVEELLARAAENVSRMLSNAAPNQKVE